MTVNSGIVMAGWDHRTLPLSELEEAKRAVEGASPASLLALGVHGAVSVLTCHRVELYLEGPVEELRISMPHLLSTWSGARLKDGPPLVAEDEGAGRHLLRVAAGLEAAVLGDGNVMGQLRSAYREACEGCHAGPILHRLFHTAFRTGKRVRTETGLGRGGRSVAGEAVVVIHRALGNLAGRRVLVLGAGEMARVAAERLAGRGVGRLLISNRSLDRAQELAESTGGEVVPWSWRAKILPTVDAVIVGTGAQHAVLRAEELEEAASSKGRLIAVDLSLPRNLEAPVKGIPELEIIDLQGLGILLEGERERRRGAVKRAEEIVEEELKKWLSWTGERSNSLCRRRVAG